MYSEDEQAVLEASSKDAPEATEAEVSDLADRYGRFQPRYVQVSLADGIKIIEHAMRLDDLLLLGISIAYQTTRNCLVPPTQMLFEVLKDGQLERI